MSNADTSFDLDALAPKSVTIKLGGEELDVLPPRLVSVMRIASLGEQLQRISELDDEAIEKIEVDLKVQLEKCIPSLIGKELSTAQVLKLTEIIATISMPTDSKELQDRGITGADSKKAE